MTKPSKLNGDLYDHIEKQLVDQVEYLERLVGNFERVLTNKDDFQDYYEHLCQQDCDRYGDSLRNPKNFRRNTEIALKEARKQLSTATKRLEDFIEKIRRK